MDNPTDTNQERGLNQMSKEEKYAAVIQENVIASIIKDAVTFVMFAGLMYFNHEYLAGSTWVDMAFILFVFLWLSAKGSKNVFNGSIDESIKWLESKR